MPGKDLPMNIGKYEILEKIGEGGFGIVYSAHDPMLDRQVAVKVLKGEAAASTDFVERFRREARLAASLHHPNIVTIIEIGEQEGRFFLVMDLLPGGMLSKLLEDGRPLPLTRVVELLRPIAEALDHAHRKGMLHRDVKPSNIILNEDGQPVLTDFGLGKSLSETGATTTGMVLGTAEYMAPEQILGHTPGPTTDIYALGVIAYQMLTGQVPFSGTTPFTIQKGHTEGKPPDPRQINPALGKGVSRVLLKCLEKVPASRYQSGADLIAALGETAKEEEQRYLENLYREAKAFMEKREFSRALEKWEMLLRAHPGFQDAAVQESQARLQVELGERYSRLVEMVDEVKTEAGAILEKDGQYPDSHGIFKQLEFGDTPTKIIDPELLLPKDYSNDLPLLELNMISGQEGDRQTDINSGSNTEDEETKSDRRLSFVIFSLSIILILIVFFIKIMMI